MISLSRWQRHRVERLANHASGAQLLAPGGLGGLRRTPGRAKQLSALAKRRYPCRRAQARHPTFTKGGADIELTTRGQLLAGGKEPNSKEGSYLTQFGQSHDGFRRRSGGK